MFDVLPLLDLEMEALRRCIMFVTIYQSTPRNIRYDSKVVTKTVKLNMIATCGSNVSIFLPHCLEVS
jgi:hypothetical protein